MSSIKSIPLTKIKSVVSAIDPGAKVILYGSRARGDSHDSSDWDILLLLNKKKIQPDDFDKLSWPLYKLGWEYGEQFSVKLYTFSDWEKRSFTPFYKEVSSEGIVL